MGKVTAKDKRELDQITKIYYPWLDSARVDDMDFYSVRLSSGHEIQLLVPLGAAVEIEEAGYDITAGFADERRRFGDKGSPSPGRRARDTGGNTRPDSEPLFGHGRR